VNQYGFLGRNTWKVKLKGVDSTWGESVQEWIDEAKYLHYLIELWDEFRSGATEERLFELIKIDTDRVFLRANATDGDEDPELGDFEFLLPYGETSALGENRILTGARTVLREHTRLALRENATPWFTVEPGGQVGMRPLNLLGAIYVHFLQELLGRTDPLFRCAACGKWFIQRHAGRIYCSNACKQKAYRRGLAKVKGDK